MIRHTFKLALLLALLFVPKVSQSQAIVAVAGQQRLFAAWSSLSGSQWALYAASSDVAGNATPSIQLSENIVPRPAVATDGERSLVVWPEVVNHAVRIRATIAGESPFTIADDLNLAQEEIAPVALWTGTEYAVLWQTADGTDVASITATGIVESTHSIAGVGRVTSAAIGRQPVLLWLEGPISAKLHAAFLGPDWNPTNDVVVATKPLSTGFGQTFLLTPQIAWNRNIFYVTWATARAGRYVRIEGTRLTADGTALDSHVTCEDGPAGTCGDKTPIAGSLIYSGCCEIGTDALLAAGSRFVKAWVGPSPQTSHDHMASLIESDGVPSAPFRLEPPTFPPKTSTLVLLPNGELAIVSIVDNELHIQRISPTRRRAARPN